MPPLQSVGVDGIAVPGVGWTDQSTTPYSSGLESSGGGTLGIATTPAGNGYQAWSLIPEDAYQTFTPTTLVGYLTRVVASTGGPSGHLDMVLHSAGTVTNAVFALYSGASFATGPIVWTADQHAAFAAGTVSMTWNGAGSPASANLAAGVTYWVYTEITTSAAPTIAGAVPTGAQSAVILNVNLTATSSFANNSMSLAAGAPTTIASNTTLTPQTSWANLNSKMWFGLRT